MSQDGFDDIQAIAGHVGVGEAILRVTVFGFDGVKPCLFDWKAKTSAGEIHATGVKSCAGGDSCQGHGLRGSIEVEDRAGSAEWANGMDNGCLGWDAGCAPRVPPGAPGNCPAAGQMGKA